MCVILRSAIEVRRRDREERVVPSSSRLVPQLLAGTVERYPAANVRVCCVSGPRRSGQELGILNDDLGIRQRLVDQFLRFGVTPPDRFLLSMSGRVDRRSVCVARFEGVQVRTERGGKAEVVPPTHAHLKRVWRFRFVRTSFVV